MVVSGALLQSLGFDTRVITGDQHVGRPGPPADHHTLLSVLVDGKWIDFDPVLKVLDVPVRAGDSLPEKHRTVWAPDGSVAVSVSMIVPDSQSALGALPTKGNSAGYMEGFVQEMMKRFGWTRDEAYDHLASGYDHEKEGPALQKHALNVHTLYHGAPGKKMPAHAPAKKLHGVETLGETEAQKIAADIFAPYAPGGYLYDAIDGAIQRGKHHKHHHGQHHGHVHHGMHGVETLGEVVQLGKTKAQRAIDNFFSQFDPTWPKARFGKAIRTILVGAGSAFGIPVGPILDSMSNLAHGGNPPAPPHVVIPFHPPPPPPPPHHMKKRGFFERLSKTEKIAAGVVGLAVIGGIALVARRKKNPRRRRRSKKGRR